MRAFISKSSGYLVLLFLQKQVLQVELKALRSQLQLCDERRREGEARREEAEKKRGEEEAARMECETALRGQQLSVARLQRQLAEVRILRVP